MDVVVRSSAYDYGSKRLWRSDLILTICLQKFVEVMARASAEVPTVVSHVSHQV